METTVNINMRLTILLFLIFALGCQDQEFTQSKRFDPDISIVQPMNCPGTPQVQTYSAVQIYPPGQLIFGTVLQSKVSSTVANQPGYVIAPFTVYTIFKNSSLISVNFYWNGSFLATLAPNAEVSTVYNHTCFCEYDCPDGINYWNSWKIEPTNPAHRCRQVTMKVYIQAVAGNMPTAKTLQSSHFFKIPLCNP